MLFRSGLGRGGSTTDLAAMLDAVAKLARRRALIVVISDFIGDGDWGRSLLRLVPRHEVVALRVIDAADDELPDVGLVVVEDAETGEQLVIDSSDPLLRARLRAGVDDQLLAGLGVLDDDEAGLRQFVVRGVHDAERYDLMARPEP